MLTDLPKFQGNNPTDVICNIYRDLGWSGEEYVDARKVIMSEKDSNLLLNFVMSFAKTEDEELGFALLWMNKGPSTSKEIPKGKVRLVPGWLC